MKLVIKDAKGGSLEIKCEKNWKLEELFNQYKEEYKKKNPNDKIKSISFSYDGEIYSEDKDKEKTLDEIGVEDQNQFSFVISYDGGLI